MTAPRQPVRLAHLSWAALSALGNLGGARFYFAPQGQPKPFGTQDRNQLRLEKSKNERVLGLREFTDGAERVVFEDHDGRQFVLDAGDRVYDNWLATPELAEDAPIIVRVAEVMRLN